VVGYRHRITRYAGAVGDAILRRANSDWHASAVNLAPLADPPRLASFPSRRTIPNSWNLLNDSARESLGEIIVTNPPAFSGMSFAASRNSFPRPPRTSFWEKDKWAQVSLFRASGAWNSAYWIYSFLETRNSTVPQLKKEIRKCD